MTPLQSREAIEAAAAILRKGKLPPKREAERIVKALDAVALAMVLGALSEGATITVSALETADA